MNLKLSPSSSSPSSSPSSSSSAMRISQHLKEWEGLGIYTSSSSFSSSSSSSSPSSKFNVSSVIKPGFLKVLPTKFPFSYTYSYSSLTISFPFITSVHSISPHHPSSFLNDSSFRPKDDDVEKSSDGLPSIAGGIVALGKFDALHVGHRELAIQASKVGIPFLLSFVGMAQVFGWEPRAPIVAKCDRERVLSSWAPLCGNVPPKEFRIDFSRVRHLTPTQFVEKLSNEFGVRGVVAGENYRFGYKAAGDASELVRLCKEYGMNAYIINSVMDKNKDRDNTYPQDKKDMGQVSSTRVRRALSKGDMKYVSKLLGRHHRLFVSAEWVEDEDSGDPKTRLTAPLSCLLNLPPKDGSYDNCYLIVGDEIELACRVVIDSSHVHLESDEKGCDIQDAIRGQEVVGIEFRG